MNFAYLCGNTVVQCPYDKNHKIAKSRIQGHLVKCEKNFPKDFREICPFNATHRFPKSEMQEHIENCPTQRYAQPELYQKYRHCGSIKSCPPSEIDVDENWDDEDLTSSLNTSYFNHNASFSSRYERFDEELRPSRGLAGVDMLESSIGSSAFDEMGSVASYMGAGRGTTKANREKLLERIRGRGKAIQLD